MCSVFISENYKHGIHKGVDKGEGGLGGLQPPHFFETIVLAIHQGFNFNCL